jgi:predicted RNase H-like HicB family nuclease
MKHIHTVITTFLTVTIEENNGIYTGYLDDIKGVIAQGNSIEDVKSELINLYQIKKKVKKKYETNKYS